MPAATLDFLVFLCTTKVVGTFWSYRPLSSGLQSPKAVRSGSAYFSTPSSLQDQRFRAEQKKIAAVGNHLKLESEGRNLLGIYRYKTGYIEMKKKVLKRPYMPMSVDLSVIQQHLMKKLLQDHFFTRPFKEAFSVSVDSSFK